MTLYFAVLDDDQVDSYVVHAIRSDRVLKTYNISVDKENKNEKPVCVL